VPQPVVGILTDDAKSYSRPRFTEEAAALGLTTRFLDPSHFDLLVDAKQLKTFYRNRPLPAPAAFMARTGSDTGRFAQAIIDGYSVIEVNSGPGFEGFEKATGINVAAEILRYTRFRLGM